MISGHALLLSGVSAAALMSRGAPASGPIFVNTALIAGTGSQTSVGTSFTDLNLTVVANDHLSSTGTISAITIPAALNGKRARLYAGTAANGQHHMRVVKNGATFAGSAASSVITSGNNRTSAHSGAITLTTGDVFKLQARAQSSTITIDSALSWLAIEVLADNFAGATIYGGGNHTSSSTTSALPFATELFDTDSFYDLGTSATSFVVPTGVSLVRLTGSIGYTGTAGQHVIGMQKNGASFVGTAAKDIEYSSTENKAMTIASAPVLVLPGDVFTLTTFSSTSNTVSDSDYRWFSIEKLEPSTKYALLQLTGNIAVGGAAVNIPWATTVADVGGWFNEGQPTRLTVPAGVRQVRVSCSATRSNTTTQWIVSLNKNGANTWPGAPAHENDTAGAETISITTGVIDVSAGDYFEMVCFGTGSAATGDSTWFAIEEVYGEPQVDGAVVETFNLTVPSTSVSAPLTGFPVMVNLSDLPSAFWASVQTNGGNIRARTADGVVNIPHDLTFFDKDDQKGRLFVKLNLSDSVDTEFTIVTLVGGAGALPENSNNGRNAVWADYKYVVATPSLINRTGAFFSSSTSGWQPHTEWIRYGFKRLTGNPHQGIASDGTNFFWVDTNEIYRGTMSYTVLNSDLNASASLAAAGLPNVNHLGDPCIYAGGLWLTATTSLSQRWLVQFNLTTLAPVSWYQINPTYYEYGATVLHDGTNFVLFGYNVSDKFIRVTDTGVFVSQTTFSTDIDSIQGSTLLPNGNFLVVGNPGDVYEVTPAGLVLGVIYKDPHNGIGEGMQYLTVDGIPTLFLVKGDGDLITVKKDNTHYDYRKIHFNNVYTDIPWSSTWSIGSSVFWTASDSQQSFITLYNPSVVTSQLNVAYHNGPDKIGSYDATNGWLYTSPDDRPDEYTDRIYGLVSTGTTRKLWNTGVVASDAIPTVAPSASTTMRLILNATRPGVEEREAYYNFIWVRDDVVSDAWMEADYANKSSPSTFYTITP